jgi:hypothetical protein
MARVVIAKPEAQQELRARDQQITLAFRKAIGVVRGLVKADLEDFHSPEEKLLRINDLLDTLMNDFLVLRVITSSVSESLEIFLTLNNRGLPLGPSDLVRGEIMSRLAIGETEAAQRRMHTRIFGEWKDITENVKEPEVFLRHYLVSTGREKVQKKKVYDKVIDRLKPTETEDRKARAADFWNKLIRASEVYNQIINPTMGGSCQYHLELLDGLMKSHRILMLNVLGDEALEPRHRDETVRLAFSLSFRWVMGGGNAQKLEDKFQKWGFEYLTDRDLDKLQDAIRDAADDLTTDVAKYLREEGDSGFVGRAVLHAVNRELTPGANPVTLDGTIHLEHIAPQTVTDEWQESLFEGDITQYEKYDSTISEIGNLTLLDFKLNLQAQQMPFGEKKDKYTLSTIKITRDLLPLNEWSETSIKQRSKWLAEMFEVIWSISPAPGRVRSFNDWLDNN